MTPPDRYHLTLAIDGRTILRGWWDNAGTADGKFDGFRDEHEAHAGAHLLLTEWDAGREWPLREWPTPAPAEDAG
ncbi:hypothetical protein V2W30_40980 (plasmid) [Streptomyces sp. Q6]|uniref:Uncharacterized protein n=1 Tax=Streptomyces citrinus TaxID=3118173 RepID=A0ACD5AQQ5_9ACTN